MEIQHDDPLVVGVRLRPAVSLDPDRDGGLVAEPMTRLEILGGVGVWCLLFVVGAVIISAPMMVYVVYFR